MDYLFQDGGAKPKKAKTTKSKTKTTKSKTPKKGGNSLGSNSKKGEMNGGEEKNPLEKYKAALEKYKATLENINSFNNRLAAFRYLASIKSTPAKTTEEIEEMLNNIEQNVLKKTLAQNLETWERILRNSSANTNHFKKQEIQNHFKEKENRYIKRLIKYHKVSENEAVKMIRGKKMNIVGEIPPKTKNDFLKNYKNILQKKKNLSEPYWKIREDYDTDKRYVKYLVNHLKINVDEAKEIIKKEKNKFFQYEFYYPPNF